MQPPLNRRFSKEKKTNALESVALTLNGGYQWRQDAMRVGQIDYETRLDGFNSSNQAWKACVQDVRGVTRRLDVINILERQRVCLRHARKGGLGAVSKNFDFVAASA
ncbi:hypothetical protein E4U21_006842 [Claviceps maximensis]|nr:hypothetical protein E4U21_006842 [Claviceps maximensis]